MDEGTLEKRIADLRREIEKDFKNVEDMAKLRESRYMDRMDAMDTAMEAALTAAKEAVDKAEAAAQKEFDAANNVKAEFATRLGTLITRDEVESALKLVRAEVTGVGSAVGAGNVKAASAAGETTGRRAGAAVTMSQVWAAIGALGVIGGLLIAFLN